MNTQTRCKREPILCTKNQEKSLHLSHSHRLNEAVFGVDHVGAGA